MAQAVIVSYGDTVTGILKTKCAIKDYNLHAWVLLVRKANPHISDLNRIYPGESLLLPGSPAEQVPMERIIENALFQVPGALLNRRVDHANLYIALGGITIDRIAENMFFGGRWQNLPLSAKRAVLIHNNPDIMNFLDSNRLPDGMPLDVTPMVLSRFDLAYWDGDRYNYTKHIRQFDPVTEEMFRTRGAQETFMFARMVEGLRDMGAAVGPNGLITSSASGAATAGEATLGTINALFKQIYDDAVKQLGIKVAASNTKTNLAVMAKFMQAHPNYPKLMQHLKTMPQFLLPIPRSKLLPPAASDDAIALMRHFGKQFCRPLRYVKPDKYMGTIARQLNGRVNLFRTMGRRATWYIPAGIALYTVHQAPMEVKLKTLFEEGFGIIGGWGGTELGYALGVSLVLALGLSPIGYFIVIFICSTAGGLAGNALLKSFGNGIFKYGVQLVSD